MAKRIKLKDRQGNQLLPLTRAELVQFTYITGLTDTLSVQAAIEALNTKANNIAQAEGNNLSAIEALQSKLQGILDEQSAVKNYIDAEDTAYLALAYAQSSSDASTAQANAYVKMEADYVAKRTSYDLMADSERTKLAGIEAGAEVNAIEGIKLNNEVLTIDSDRIVDLGSIATSSALETLSGRVDDLETAYASADSAIITAYTTADSAIITAYEAADTALSGRITALETSYSVTVTETAGSGDILKGYQITQNGVTLGTINIPKDMVATSGEVVYCTKSNNEYTEVSAGTTGAIACIKMTVGNGNSSDTFYVEVADLIEYNGVQSNSEITLSDTGHVIEATVGAISSSKITFTPAGENPTDTTVQAALRDLYAQIGAGGSVASQITAAIEALDADLDASGTAQHSGTFVMSGVTEVDGVITSVDSVEVEAAGAAASAKATIDDYTVNSKKISTNPVLDGSDINVDDTAATKETVKAAIERLGTADGNSVKTVNSVSPTNGVVVIDAGDINTETQFKIGSDSYATTHTIDEVLQVAALYVAESGTYEDTTI